MPSKYVLRYKPEGDPEPFTPTDLQKVKTMANVKIVDETDKLMLVESDAETLNGLPKGWVFWPEMQYRI